MTVGNCFEISELLACAEKLLEGIFGYREETELFGTSFRAMPYGYILTV